MIRVMVAFGMVYSSVGFDPADIKKLFIKIDVISTTWLCINKMTNDLISSNLLFVGASCGLLKSFLERKRHLGLTSSVVGSALCSPI